MKRAKDVFVYLEQDKTGAPSPKSLALLQTGRAIAAVSGGCLAAVCFGNDASACAQKARAFGADQILFCEETSRTLDASDDAETLSELLTERPARALLVADTPRGRALAAIVGARLRAVVVAHVESARMRKRDKRIVWKTVSMGGFLQSDAISEDDAPEIGVFTAGALTFSEEVTTHDRTLSQKRFYRSSQVPINNAWRLVKSTPKPQTAIEDAEIIVAGGRGAGGSEGFALIGRLADALGAAVGASRVAVDMGWAPKSCLIGQSGKTVRPKLYVNCGISGSVQHITGMRTAECVVSINSDPKALIFNVSDYCIVGDLFEILPSLIAKANERRSIVL